MKNHNFLYPFWLALTVLLVVGMASAASKKNCAQALEGYPPALEFLTGEAYPYSSISTLSSGSKIDKADLGQFLYILFNGKQGVQLAYSEEMLSEGPTNHATLFKSLKSSYSDLDILAAGEFYINEDGKLDMINNRSGSFRPGSEHLDFAIRDITSRAPQITDLQVQDFSKVSTEHPMYIENKFLDILHTISYVEMLGQEKFLKLLKKHKKKKAFLKALDKAYVEASILRDKQYGSVNREEDQRQDLSRFQQLQRYVDKNMISTEHESAGIPYDRLLELLKAERAQKLIFIDHEDYLYTNEQQIYATNKARLNITYVSFDIVINKGGENYQVTLSFFDPEALDEIAEVGSEGNEWGKLHNDVISEARRAFGIESRSEFEELFFDGYRMGLNLEPQHDEGHILYADHGKGGYRQNTSLGPGSQKW